MRLRIYLAVLLFAAAAGVTAQPAYIAPGEEAPPALLDTEFGSADVSLFLMGFWESELSASFGLLTAPGYQDPVFEPFPDMTPGVSFRQTPDLALFLLINDRFSFEVSFIEGYELNRFVLGYDGAANEPLQTVRVGNADVALGEYPYLPLGNMPENSIGAMSLFELGDSTHEVMLRYQPAGVERLYFRGTDEIERTEVRPDRMIRGRFFVLPDSNVSELKVYREVSSDNDDIDFTDTNGRAFSEVSSGDATLSSQDGTVILSEPAHTRLLVYYTKSGVSVGDPTLGTGALVGITGGFPDHDASPVDFSFSSDMYLDTTMSDLSVSDGTRDLLLLYDPGAFSPFEHLGYYDSSLQLPTDSFRIRVRLSAYGSVQFTADSMSSMILVRADGVDQRNPRARYPLSFSLPEIYGPNASGSLGRRLEIETSTPNESIVTRDAVPGTVRVTVNGRPEERFSVDDSGAIELFFPVGPSDLIEVTYQSTSGAGEGGDIAFGYGSKLYLTDALSLSLGIASFWNISTRAYSSERNDHPGSVAASAAVDLSLGPMLLSAQAAVTVMSPDTSGTFRILGLDGDQLRFAIEPGAVYPASSPAASPGAYAFDAASRGALLFRDYYSYSARGSRALNRYDWTGIPDDQIGTYEDDQPIGPYVVSTVGDDVSTTAMALDFEFDGQGSWVGGTLSAPLAVSPLDLSSYSVLEFAWFAESLPDSVIHVQLGATDEDLDGDGELDAETSELSDGFAFDDSGDGISLRVGGTLNGGNGSIDSEDLNENGVLDTERSDQIVTRTFETTDADFPSAEWKTVRIPLSATERRRLRDVRSMRILIAGNETGTSNGRLLIAEVALSEPDFVPFPEDETDLHLAADSSSAIVNDLIDAFPKVDRRFHGDGSEQRVLRADFSAAPASAPLEFRGRTNGVSPSEYAALMFYARSDTEARMDIRLSDDDEDIVVIQVVLPGDDSWHEYQFRYIDGEVYRDGELIEAMESSYVSGIGESNTVYIAISSDEPGTCYLDEVHLAESSLSAGFGGEIEATFSFPGPLLEFGTLPIVADVTLNQFAAAGSKSFSPFAATGGVAYLQSTTEASAIVGLAKLAGRFDFASRADLFTLRGGYDVTVPSVPFPVTISDSFSSYGEHGSPGYVRESSATLDIGRFMSASLLASVEMETDSINQDWTGSIDINPFSALEFALEANAFEFSTEDTVDPGYAAAFGDTYRLLFPADIDDTERGSDIAGDLRVGGDSISVTLSPELGFRSDPVEPRGIDMNGGIELSVPVTFSGSPSGETSFPLLFEINFVRPFSLDLPVENLSGVPGSGSNIVDDAILASAELSAFGFVMLPPFYDIFAGRTRGLFLDAMLDADRANYDTGVSLRVTRSGLPQLSDLVFPSTIYMSIERKLARSFDTVSDRIVAGGELRWQAINLFGSLGLRPVFARFTSDEYSYGVSGETDVPLIGDDQSYRFETDMLIKLLTGRRTLSFSNRLQADISDAVELTNGTEFNLAFRRDFESVRIPLLNTRIDDEVYLTNTESISAEWTGADGGIDIRLRHESVFSVSDYGHVLGSITAGVKTREAAEEGLGRTWHYGAEGVISVTISL